MKTSTAHQLSLADALRIAQQQHIILRATGRAVKLWSPGRRIPGPVRRTIQQHKAEVLRLLSIGDIAVCPNPALHRASWSYFAGHYICDVCSRIDRHLRAIAA